MVKRGMSVEDFKAAAESPEHAPPKFLDDHEKLERHFWCALQCLSAIIIIIRNRKTIAFGRAIYGADVQGSVSDPKKNV